MPADLHEMLRPFTEVNPDKGTETLLTDVRKQASGLSFTEVNPDKGTETKEIKENNRFTNFLVYRS